MALLIIDSATTAIGKGPEGGFTIQLKDIEGMPEGLTILLPFEGEHATEVWEAIGDIISHTPPSVNVATPAEAREELQRHAAHRLPADPIA